MLQKGKISDVASIDVIFNSNFKIRFKTNLTHMFQYSFEGVPPPPTPRLSWKLPHPEILYPWEISAAWGSDRHFFSKDTRPVPGFPCCLFCQKQTVLPRHDRSQMSRAIFVRWFTMARAFGTKKLHCRPREGGGGRERWGEEEVGDPSFVVAHRNVNRFLQFRPAAFLPTL